MRVNCYAEELTNRVEVVEKIVHQGSGPQKFVGLRFYLYLPVTELGRGETGTVGVASQHQGPFLHRGFDDDSSAVTFWGTPAELREMIGEAVVQLDDLLEKNVVR